MKNQFIFRVDFWMQIWSSFGAILVPFWINLGSLWAPFGLNFGSEMPPWGRQRHFFRFLVILVSILLDLGAFWNHCGRDLARIWQHLGGIWAPSVLLGALGLSGGAFKCFWVDFGCIFGRFWFDSHSCWKDFACIRRSLERVWECFSCCSLAVLLLLSCCSLAVPCCSLAVLSLFHCLRLQSHAFSFGLRFGCNLVFSPFVDAFRSPARSGSIWGVRGPILR